MREPKIYLLPVVAELENKTGRRLKDTEYAKAIGITRQSFKALVEGKTDGVKNETLGKLLCFFEREGMEVTPNDLYTTEAAPTP